MKTLFRQAPSLFGAAAAAAFLGGASTRQQANAMVDICEPFPGMMTSCSFSDEVDWSGTINFLNPIRCKTPKVGVHCVGANNKYGRKNKDICVFLLVSKRFLCIRSLLETRNIGTALFSYLILNDSYILDQISIPWKNTQHNTPPLGLISNLRVLDEAESANAEQCVYGNMWTRYLQGQHFSVHVPPLFWKNLTREFIPRGLLSSDLPVYRTRKFG